MIKYRVSQGSEWLEAQTMPELLPGIEVSAGGYLYLGSLTSLPEGVTLSAGGYLYLGSAKSYASDLRPWEEEMADCEAAFIAADPKVGDLCQFLHHEKAFERLTEPWRRRFNYVRQSKSRDELAWRFRMMRPVAVPLEQAVRGLLKMKVVKQ
jgi:hypothetical protein